MSKEETLRFKVCVSSGNPEFYSHIKEFGPYYRSRRLLELAQIGFSLQKGVAVNAAILAPIVELPPPSEVFGSHQQNHYKISEDAASQLVGMLDTVDSWGTT